MDIIILNLCNWCHQLKIYVFIAMKRTVRRSAQLCVRVCFRHRLFPSVRCCTAVYFVHSSNHRSDAWNQSWNAHEFSISGWKPSSPSDDRKIPLQTFTTPGARFFPILRCRSRSTTIFQVFLWPLAEFQNEQMKNYTAGGSKTNVLFHPFIIFIY